MLTIELGLAIRPRFEPRFPPAHDFVKRVRKPPQSPKKGAVGGFQLVSVRTGKGIFLRCVGRGRRGDPRNAHGIGVIFGRELKVRASVAFSGWQTSCTAHKKAEAD
jgi:hypothetical protein